MSTLLTNVIVTAYCSCKLCCGPDAANITAAGIAPKESITIAAPRSIPLGTKVKILGHTYTVQDRTAKRYNGRWDIYFHSHTAAKNFGLKHATVEILHQ